MRKVEARWSRDPSEPNLREAPQGAPRPRAGLLVDVTDAGGYVLETEFGRRGTIDSAEAGVIGLELRADEDGRWRWLPHDDPVMVAHLAALRQSD